MESLIYRYLIDPLLRKQHKRVAALIDKRDRVIDVACGNGTLALYIGTNAEQVIGIDLSEASIAAASKRVDQKVRGNVSFRQLNALELNQMDLGQFTVATISMALHQFKVEEAIHILRSLRNMVDQVIILDYNFPLPNGFGGVAARAIERLAGQEHNRNFLAYQKLGGTPALLAQAGYEKKRIVQDKGVFTIVRS